MKTKTVTIEVTAEDIAKGKPRVCWLCPIALAIGRAVALFQWADASWIRIGGVSVETPGVVADFIRAFDRRAEVQPFRFRLKVPAGKAQVLP